MPATDNAISDPDDGSGRATRLEIDLQRIRENLTVIRSRVGPRKVMAVVKANAYGHGLVPVAYELQRAGADALAVAFLEEGLQLRQAGISLPILVFGGLSLEQLPHFLRHDLTLTVPSVEKLRQINEVASALGARAKIHLKIDTGMERIGTHWFSAGKLLEASLECPHVEVEGIYSHLANADTSDPAPTRLQLERFLEVMDFFPKHSLPTPIRHLANSGAILQAPDCHLDMVRPGILLYGVYPSEECARTFSVLPAMTWRSCVVFFKVVPSNHPVSYGSTWTSPHPVRMATIPAGYGDGYFRSLSNRAEVLIRGRRYPVAGRVCMDQFMVNLESDGTAYNGDEVILMGSQGAEVISAETLARQAGTIPYEILTHINTRVPRVYRNALEVLHDKTPCNVFSSP